MCLQDDLHHACQVVGVATTTLGWQRFAGQLFNGIGDPCIQSSSCRFGSRACVNPSGQSIYDGAGRLLKELVQPNLQWLAGFSLQLDGCRP